MRDNVIYVIDEVVIEQLPTYANFPEVGSVKKLYITDDSILYRWSPEISDYIRVGGKDGATAQDLIDAINEVKKAIPTKVSQLENDVGYLSEESDPTVPDWAKAETKPSYTPEEVGALPANTYIPTVPTEISAFNNDVGYLTEHQSLEGYAKETFVGQQVSDHNTETNAHNDIRLLIQGLTSRLNTLADSDDTTLDQLSEIIVYIKTNKNLIDGITTSKVNVTDIIDNLTTSVSNKPLSAAQGVALKRLIDAIIIPTKVSELTNDAKYLTSYTESDPTVPDWAKANTKPSYTAEEVGALPATTAIPTKLSDLTEDKSHRTVTDTEKSKWNNPPKELPNLPEDASKYYVYGLRSRIDPESGSSYTYWEAVGDAPVLRPPERIWIEETE